LNTALLLAAIVLLASANLLTLVFGHSHAKSDKLRSQVAKLDDGLRSLDALIRDEFGRNRGENQKSARENREELTNSFRFLSTTINQLMNNLVSSQRGQFEASARQVAEIRDAVESRLQSLQRIVDEKLQDTVEKRFDESFKLISGQLEQVHKGLGEMQTLASGVGDLKKVLSNVKTRGNLGEIQLGAILEQFLSSEQYERNAVVRRNSQERVEYAIKLPGGDRPLLLPVDAKFPTEDYARLQNMYDNAPNASAKEIETASKQFENTVRKSARDIRDKYIEPPVTTDFAIMFVPSEGLYAEILRRPGLFEALQREFKVTVVGPANLVAFLNSLQMGFRTLAIEKRSGEAWEVLGAVKTQFSAFGDLLDKTRHKLQEAANVIDQAGEKARAVERRLKSIEELPRQDSDEDPKI
jgi:DNA recombination protein RmuC